MVDPRLLHQVTVELCTGFLLLAGISVAAKAAADAWTRSLSGRVRRLDRTAALVAAFAEPASFVALLAGVAAGFLSMYTGSQAWPADDLGASPTVHNKILLVGLSQTAFLAAVVIRSRFRARVWATPSTGAFYALLIFAGDGLMVVQNSVGGHLAGTGSLLDDVLVSLGIDEVSMWVLPPWAAITTLVAFPLATVYLGAKLRASAHAGTRLEIGRLARDVKDLLVYARRANLSLDASQRRITKANAAARRGRFPRATRLMARARRDLMAALSFEDSPEGDWVLAGPEPLGVFADESVIPGSDNGPPALAGPAAPAVTMPLRDGAVFERRSRALARAGLSAAVDLSARSQGEFADDPSLAVQRELRWARGALEERKLNGQDLTGPIEVLKAATEHVRNEEWEDALRLLRQFRLESSNS